MLLTRRSSVAAPSNRTEKVAASRPILETPAAAKGPRLAGRKRPKARADLVSATVYLRPDKLALIKQNCSDTNRRISDLISEAVDDYLRKPR
jgi:hypothetical protein